MVDPQRKTSLYDMENKTNIYSLANIPKHQAHQPTHKTQQPSGAENINIFKFVFFLN